MKAQVEIITPAYAKQLLEQNPNNRRLTRAIAQRYATDMKAGRWVNNGQGIAIAPNGDLLDGQHRLQAVVMAQMPIAMLVVRGVPTEAFKTMDSGKARGVADVLTINGHANAKTVAAGARLTLAYVAGGAVSTGAYVTRAQTIEFALDTPLLQDAASLALEHRPARPLIHTGPMVAVLALGLSDGTMATEAASFAEGVVLGVGLYRGDARLTLREWFLKRRSASEAIRTSDAFSVVGKAWNAHAKGRELLRLHAVESMTRETLPIVGFSREAFPHVVDLERATPVKVRSNLPKRLAVAPLQFGEAA